MKLSKIIVKFISIFILISSSALAQEKTIETQTIICSSKENIEATFYNFSLLNWEARKKEFPNVLDKIEHVKSDCKSLLLARAYSISSDKTNLDKAIKLIEDYLQIHPESSEGYLVYANILIEKIGFIEYLGPPSQWRNKEDIKLRDTALSNIEKSLILKKSSEAYYLKALLSEGEDKIELLETSISLDSSRNDAWRELTDELGRKHRYDEAISKLELWFKNSKSSEQKIEILKKQASVLKDKKEPEKAIRLLTSALVIRNATGSEGLETIYSGIDGIYLGLAESYKDAKIIHIAEEFYKKYLKINPKSWYIRVDLASLYHNSGQINKAISEYEQVLAYNENETQSIYNLGLLFKESDEEKSKELFTKYIKLEIDNEDEYSIKWVENAKSQLRSLGVYDYPENKNKLKEWEPNENNFSKFSFLLLFILLIPLAWKYKKATRALIIFSMTLAIAIISFFEAQNYNPSLVSAFLYFIPVISIGTFLLYFFRKPQ